MNWLKITETDELPEGVILMTSLVKPWYISWLRWLELIRQCGSRCGVIIEHVGVAG